MNIATSVMTAVCLLLGFLAAVTLASDQPNQVSKNNQTSSSAPGILGCGNTLTGNSLNEASIATGTPTDAHLLMSTRYGRTNNGTSAAYSGKFNSANTDEVQSFPSRANASPTLKALMMSDDAAASTKTPSFVIINSSTSNNETHKGFPDLDDLVLLQLSDDAGLVVERYRPENKMLVGTPPVGGLMKMRMGNRERRSLLFCSRVPTPTTPTTAPSTKKPAAAAAAAAPADNNGQGGQAPTPAQCAANPNLPNCIRILADAELAQAVHQLRDEQARYRAIHRFILAKKHQLLHDQQERLLAAKQSTSQPTTTQPTTTSTKRGGRSRDQDQDDDEYNDDEEDYYHDEEDNDNKNLINQEDDSPIPTGRNNQGGQSNGRQQGRGGQRRGKGGGRRGGRHRGNNRLGEKQEEEALLHGRAEGREGSNVDNHRNAQHDEPRLKEEVGAGL